jgi:hypothetical protein
VDIKNGKGAKEKTSIQQIDGRRKPGEYFEKVRPRREAFTPKGGLTTQRKRK